jgi:hypothetical protein
MPDTKFIKVFNSAFSLADAAERGIARAQLAAWAKAGKVERVARGIYRSPNLPRTTIPEIEVLIKRGTVTDRPPIPKPHPRCPRPSPARASVQP